jgi:hypothetical protein
MGHWNPWEVHKQYITFYLHSEELTINFHALTPFCFTKQQRKFGILWMKPGEWINNTCRVMYVYLMFFSCIKSRLCFFYNMCRSELLYSYIDIVPVE